MSASSDDVYDLLVQAGVDPAIANKLANAIEQLVERKMLSVANIE